MAKKKVLLARNLPEAVIARAEELFDLTVREKTQPMTPSEMRSGLAIYDGMMPSLGDHFSADIFNEFGRPRCKILANFGVGYNHIDVDAARAHSVTVTNTPGAVTDATADIAMTLILMSARRAGEGERLVRSGAWEGWHPTQMLGLHVSGKTVGIVGMGRIGQAIARRCHFGFGMEVLFFNRSEKTVDFPAEQVADLVDMASRCDIVVAATPGGAETRHLIGADVFAAMKQTAHVVNISRGDVVDEAALIAALQAGEIAGAGLDVYEFEPQVPDALRAMENVVLLPHLGTAAEEVRTDMGMMVLDNLVAFFEGREPPNKL
ncbi:2-hydroxyacid dehydrogenase [Lutimaribacter saemankumensis]|uniref:Hydroxypyruvate reductase n=1 Tax=Lutimaribacter saemankumensis TaxID=490829 RepID=A0A1G8QXE1_9RHOB|nr:D-glycerate dehydrogenase [Lutimaribacter saemankumensis]SDJ09404.1 hydroxypyruvate reductase [Lutimaribacter saemankumensis]